jgi:hypothetical protein
MRRGPVGGRSSFGAEEVMFSCHVLRGRVPALRAEVGQVRLRHLTCNTKTLSRERFAKIVIGSECACTAMFPHVCIRNISQPERR